MSISTLSGDKNISKEQVHLFGVDSEDLSAALVELVDAADEREVAEENLVAAKDRAKEVQKRHEKAEANVRRLTREAQMEGARYTR